MAAGMTAVGHIAKSSNMPLGVKIGATAAGGAIAGCLFVVTNAINTLVQRKVEDKTSSPGPGPSSNSSNDSYPASSVLEDSENNSSTIETIMDLLNSNLVLNMCILYLLVALAVLFISTKVVSKKYNLTFIKNIFGERFYYYFIKGLSYTNKSNEIWMFIVWILLIIASLGTTYIAYLLITHIDIISETYQNSKK